MANTNKNTCFIIKNIDILSMETIKKQFIEKYKNRVEIKPTPQYSIYQFRLDNCSITAYEKNKIMFQGNTAETYYKIAMKMYDKIKNNVIEKIVEDFDINECTDSPLNSFKTNESINDELLVKYKQIVAPIEINDGISNLFYQTYPQQGSDEVGTGDFFGPVVVTCALVEPEYVDELKSLSVQDSKALTDDMILVLAPKLKKIVKHITYILSNEKYNEVHKTENLNAIKAIMHNYAQKKLYDKTEGIADLKIIDKFCDKGLYYGKYLAKTEENKILRDIHFEVKAENKFLSVGCASIIARYDFLMEMKKLSEKYGMKIPTGASSLVDKCAANFIKKYGEKELENVAKTHFVNLQKAKKILYKD